MKIDNLISDIDSKISNIDTQIETDLLLEHIWNNITFEIFLKFILVYFIIIWIAIVVWVIKDITNRTNSIILEVFSILVVTLFTPFGIFIYLLIRPGKTLMEKHYADIEDNLDVFGEIIKDKIEGDDEKSHCYKCDEPLSQDFKFCPNCKVELRVKCESCKRSIYPGWNHCPYCGVKKKKEVKETKEELKKKETKEDNQKEKLIAKK